MELLEVCAQAGGVLMRHIEPNSTITVKDNASTPNQPANETFQLAGSSVPTVRTNDNRVNVGDVVTLSGRGFTAVTAADIATCNCGVNNYCVKLSFNAGTATNGPNLCNTAVPPVCTSTFSGYSYTIPAAPSGRRNLTGADLGTGVCPGNTGGTAPRTSLNQVFFVEPKITKTGQSCGGTKTVTITGTGFAASKAITLTWQGADVPPGGSSVSPINRITDAAGSFAAIVFTLPATGSQQIGAHDADRNFSTNTIPNPCP